jgi:mercuric transport protein
MNGDYTMTRMAAAFVALLISSSAFAAQRTVTLAVQNMFCADCPFVVRRSLETVPGVVNAMVSFKDKTAVVTYDDAKVDIKLSHRRDNQCRLPLRIKTLNIVILQSTITCPNCGTARKETMPTDACRYFYECTGCGTRLKPKSGDCCVFCSYGSVPCPPMQAEHTARRCGRSHI